MLWECECQAGIEKARSANDSVNTIISLVKNIIFTVPRKKAGKKKEERIMQLNNVDFETYLKNYPDANGYFGKYGGAYIPEE